MWREYSRETPARPGLAVIMAAIALAGNTALAWVMTQRANPSRGVKLSRWPISFSLPEGFELAAVDNSGRYFEYSDGTHGEAIFDLGGDAHPMGVINVKYLLLDLGSTLDDACDELGPTELSEAESITFGEFKGLMIRGIASTSPPALVGICIGIHPCGLAVRFEQTLALEDVRRLGRFESMLFSLKMADWSAPRPPWVRLSSEQVSS